MDRSRVSSSESGASDSSGSEYSSSLAPLDLLSKYSSVERIVRWQLFCYTYFVLFKPAATLGLWLILLRVWSRNSMTVPWSCLRRALRLRSCLSFKARLLRFVSFLLWKGSLCLWFRVDGWPRGMILNLQVLSNKIKVENQCLGLETFQDFGQPWFNWPQKRKLIRHDQVKSTYLWPNSKMQGQAQSQYE